MNKRAPINFNNIVFFFKKNYIYILHIIITIKILYYSPFLFIFVNSLSIGVFIYFRINLRYVFFVNIFFLFSWFFIYSYYAYLLTHEPSILINSGDSWILNPDNIILILNYTMDYHPSLGRNVFIETLMILHLFCTPIFGFYPTIYFF